MHSPFVFVYLMHQNLSVRALFCHNSLTKVYTQLLMYEYVRTRGTIFLNHGFIVLMHASKGILNLPTSSLHLCSPFQQNR